MLRNFIACGIIVLATVVGCGTSDPSEARSEAVFFTCAKHNGDAGICRINPDRSGFQRLVLFAFSPAVSPDGTSIAYICPQAHDGVMGAVCMMNADGSNQRTVIDTIPSWFTPDWSVDGRLAFQRHGEIWVTNADGSGQVQLTHTGGLAADPAWSPDGLRIVFGENIIADDAGALWIMNSDGSNLQLLLDLPGTEHRPRWSPDGTRIAFHLSKLPHVDSYLPTDIFVYDLASKTTQRLTTFGTVVQPEWAPDGRGLVFSGRVSDAASQLFIMNPDGSGSRHLTIPAQASSVGSAVWAESP